MHKININSKAQQIRDVIRYIDRFKNAVIVIYINSKLIDTPAFSGHIRDISLMHRAGLKVIIVPGAAEHIDKILSSSGICWEYKDGIRVTNSNAIFQIKTAAFDSANIVMTGLAANQISAVIGNWVRARAKGILDGFDYGCAGEIDKIEKDALRSIISQDFVPIFPCIGWSSAGKPYNISSISLAQKIAVILNADKLFFLTTDARITKNYFSIPENIGLSETGGIPAMNLEELNDFYQANTDCKNQKIISLLKSAENACRNGVKRTHILDGTIDGVLPCEIFSDLGSGTMIYSKGYGKIRNMIQQDIPYVLSVMQPFIEQKILIPRTEKQLSENIEDYIVYGIDGSIRGCAAFHVYPDFQAEIAALAVEEDYCGLGIGFMLVKELIKKAKRLELKSVFILTTQTSDWFEKFNFVQDDIFSLPKERRIMLEKSKRNSKLYRLYLNNFEVNI